MEHAPRFLKLCEDVRSRITEVSIDEIGARVARGETFELIDVREESELAAGRIKGARHLGKGVIERDVEETIPDKTKEIILYCGGGFRSALSADNLQKMGYRGVVSMDGGWRGWNDAGGPVEK